MACGAIHLEGRWALTLPGIQQPVRLVVLAVRGGAGSGGANDGLRRRLIVTAPILNPALRHDGRVFRTLSHLFMDLLALFGREDECLCAGSVSVKTSDHPKAFPFTVT